MKNESRFLRNIVNKANLKIRNHKKQNVSNIFVLHSLNGDTLKMWGQDIKEKFSEKKNRCYNA